jgi:hypothetical protein
MPLLAPVTRAVFPAKETSAVGLLVMRYYALFVRGALRKLETLPTMIAVERALVNSHSLQEAFRQRKRKGGSINS